jgi:DNA-binding transcriptional regulator LsrR (DeoR family)
MAEKEVQSRREESIYYARQHYEEKLGLSDISSPDGRHKDIKTISRIMNSGRTNGWWQLKVLPLGKTSETTIDEALSRQLRQKTVFTNAIVVNCRNVDGAQHDELPPNEAERPGAYIDSDILHLQISRHAASYLAGRLGHGYKVGIGSGRASTYTADFFCKDARAGKVRRLVEVAIFSLVGGVRDVRWSQELAPEFKDVPANLDADEGASLLAEALHVQRESYLHLVNLPISISTNDLPAVVKAIANHLFEMPDRLDMMISGIGVLNTGHHFIDHCQGAGLAAISDDLQKLQQLQSKDPAMLESIGEVCHRLFWCGDGPTPHKVQKIIRQVNSKVIAVPFKVINEAKELLLVAGGRQKLPVLTRLSKTASSDAAQVPFRVDRITLVTDSWTARKILERN